MLLPYTPLISLHATALDTETTGLDFRSARIVQIAALPLQGARIAEAEALDLLVNPREPIPVASTQIHGISDADVAAQPDFAGHHERIAAAMHERALIGYNIEFDISMLERECRLAGLPWKRPRALDVRLLAHLIGRELSDDSLEAIAARLGVAITDRHTALGDARAAAQIYAALMPLLRRRGVRTLGEAEAASREVLDRVIQPRGRAADTRVGPGENGPPLPDPVFVQLDSYPYRHRAKDVMRPIVTVDAGISLSEAARTMIDSQLSSLIVEGAGEPGIVTERDILWALASRAEDHTVLTVGDIMKRPVQTVHQDDFIYRAIGRMDRKKFRHLGVADDSGALVGVLSARRLLAQRASAAIALGDEIEHAPDVEALGLARAKLAAVARSLVREGIDARSVSAIISTELRALTTRAAELAEQWMAEQDKGPPPCRYALLILGSAARGESLLSADQDNALVFEHGEAGGPEDGWFAAFAERLADILDTAGVPYCTGGVMARNALWRHSLEDWRGVIDGWLRRSRAQDILEVDIFFDARCVHGETALGQDTIDYAWEKAADTPMFLAMLAENARQSATPFTMLGTLRTDEQGRVDLKRYGLLPIFTGARMLAIRNRKRAMSTPDRLSALKASEHYSTTDLDKLDTAHRTLLSAMLNQQLADIDAGIAPSSRVAPKSLPKPIQGEIKTALGDVPIMNGLVSEGRMA